jgi:hypothetical protein
MSSIRKIVGAVFALALLAAALGISSKTIFATNAARMAYGGLPVGEETPAEKIAYRFPEATEVLRPMAFIRDSRAPIVPARGKADKLQASIADCGGQNWPFMATECLVAASSKPVPMVNRPATVERRIADNTSELVRAPAANAIAPPACRYNLAAATARMERALARVKGVRTGRDADTCAAYRRDFFDVVQARELTALCKTGAERIQDLGRIDVAVENINGAIALSCGS